MTQKNVRRAKSELRLDDESEAQRELSDKPASYVIRQKNLAASQCEPPLTALSEDEKRAFISQLVTRYARELDTSRDYVTRGQVEDDVWGMRDGRSNKFVEDVAATVIEALDSGTGTPGSRAYDVRAISRHAAYRWLVLPSHQNRYVRDQVGYRREKTRISDPEPFPQVPSAGAWQRWEAEMASYALWYVTARWLNLPNGEDVLLERFASEVERRLPNRGHGVQPQDVSTRLSRILSNAIGVAQSQGSTVLTDPNGTRWVLPLMKPRKRF